MNNTKEYTRDRVTTLHVGGDKIWADNIRKAFESITTPYFIMFLEDYFINRPISTQRINELIEYMEANNVAYINLLPGARVDEHFPNDFKLGGLSKYAAYRTSLRIAIWNTRIFKSLLREGESAWDMERKGTIRSRELNESFLSVLEPLVRIYPNAGVRQGKWLYDTKRILGNEGIAIDSKKRSVDYELKYRFVLDRLRKKPIARWLRRVPIFGTLGASVWARISHIKLNSLFNKKNN